MSDIRASVNDHLHRRDMTTQAATDPHTHALAEMTRNILRLAEMAMREEGVPPETIARVIQLVIYGAIPNPVDVRARVDIQERFVEYAKRATPSMMVPVAEAWDE